MHPPVQGCKQRLRPTETQVSAPEATALCWLDTRTACEARLSPFEMSAKALRVPKTEDGEMMTGFLRWWYTAARSRCREKDRKQNITIGRRPCTALESKSPALNHSQQNNHKCRRKKDQIMRYYLLFITVPKVNVYLYPYTNLRCLHRF